MSNIVRMWRFEMNRLHVNTTIQFRKMDASGVHDISVLQFNYKLIPPSPSHSLIYTYYKVLSQEFYAAILLCSHDIFRRGLLLLH